MRARTAPALLALGGLAVLGAVWWLAGVSAAPPADRRAADSATGAGGSAVRAAGNGSEAAAGFHASDPGGAQGEPGREPARPEADTPGRSFALDLTLRRVLDGTRLPGARVAWRDTQQRELGWAATDRDGVVRLELPAQAADLVLEWTPRTPLLGDESLQWQPVSSRRVSVVRDLAGWRERATGQGPMADVVRLDTGRYLTGIVRGADGELLADAIVRDETSGLATWTAPDGRFELRDLPATQGPLPISIGAFGHAPLLIGSDRVVDSLQPPEALVRMVQSRVEHDAGRELPPVQVEWPVPELVQLAGPAALTGRVFGLSGESLGGAHVWVTGGPTLDEGRGASPQPVARTDALGTFLLEGLPEGRVDVMASWEGGERSLQLAARGVLLDAGSPASVRLGPAGQGLTLAGRLLDGAGRPLPEHVVEARILVAGLPLASSSLASSRTDAAGHYELAPLPAGRLRLSVLGPQERHVHPDGTTFRGWGRESSRWIDLDRDDLDRTLVVSGAPEPSFIPGVAVSVQGEVVDEVGIMPPGAVVAVSDSNGRELQRAVVRKGPDGHGRFALILRDGFEEGDLDTADWPLWLVASAPGRVCARRLLDPPALRITVETIRLPRLAQLALTVVGVVSRAPCRGAAARLHVAGSGVPASTIELEPTGEGVLHATFDRLDGRFELVVEAPGYLPWRSVEDLPAGGTELTRVVALTKDESP